MIWKILTFTNPWWLVACLAVCVPAYIAARRRMRARPVSRVSVCMQMACVIAAAIALAGPNLIAGSSTPLPWLVLSDVSASMRGQQDILLPPTLATERYWFAANVASKPADVDRTGTRISQALRVAAGEARNGRASGVLIKTDGQFMDDRWEAIAGELGQVGVPVIIIPAADRIADARIDRFVARRDMDGSVRLTVAVVSNVSDAAVLTISRGPNATPVAQRRLTLAPNRPQTVVFADEHSPAGFRRYRATITPGDILDENNTADAILPSRTPLIAWVAGKGTNASDLVSIDSSMRPEGIPLEDMPHKADSLGRYSAVVMVLAPGQLPALAARRALQRYVMGGGGLLLVGTGPADGPADAGDPLNVISPLIPVPYSRSPLMVTVILDASGSMANPPAGASAGRTRFNLASDAVLNLQRYLTNKDRLSVITFADSPTGLYDSGSNPIDYSSLGDALAKIEPAGATKLFDAIKLAAAARDDKGRRRLTIIVSDLNTERFDATQAARLIRQNGSSLAIVAISADGSGDGAGLPVEKLTELTGGHLTCTGDLRGLAGIFSKLVNVGRGPRYKFGELKMAMKDAPAGASSLEGMRVSSIPCAAPKKTIVLINAGGEAVLGATQVGLGRSAMFAIDPTRLPGQSDRDHVAKVLGGILKWTMRPDTDSRFDGKVTVEDRGVKVTVSAIGESGSMNNLELVAFWRDVSGGMPAHAAEMKQVAPGRYEAILEKVTTSGVAVVLMKGSTVWQSRGKSAGVGEFARTGANWENLNRLAKLTGGRLIDERSGMVTGVGEEAGEKAGEKAGVKRGTVPCLRDCPLFHGHVRSTAKKGTVPPRRTGPEAGQSRPGGQAQFLLPLSLDDFTVDTKRQSLPVWPIFAAIAIVCMAADWLWLSPSRR